ncbi:predicted protein [Lichtheimia corymbifera JMRC:FSU:9682]|uniref:Uncharacterized protein n=1 Tax=Lichtheimia corymbifera JMRC:FSU:9682 TaxID=1263082 RepID=A0A068RYZ7_9FUNG|nr:predicted protein [Lichtheimia corymbifera JMRC:FSU:9682]
MKRGTFHRTKLLVSVKRTLGASFTINLADPRFRNVTTSQSESEVDLLNFFSTRLVVTLGESEKGLDDRETCTQGALHPRRAILFD